MALRSLAFRAIQDQPVSGGAVQLQAWPGVCGQSDRYREDQGRGLANLRQSNDGDGWCTIDEAIASGRPFTVETAPDILPCDADRPEDGDAIRELVTELKSAGHRPVLVASGHDRPRSESR